MSEAVGLELVNEIENAIFGFENLSSSGGEESTTELFADDEFFHPTVIHDDETCKWILHHRISHLNLKLWDLMLFLPSSLFLSYLLIGVLGTRQRIRGLNNSCSLLALYSMVFLCVFAGISRALLNMLVELEFPNSSSEKILWVGARLVYMVAELSMLGIGATYHFLGKKGLLKIVVSASVFSAFFCAIELYLELNRPYYGHKVVHTGRNLYGGGGPQYWALMTGLVSVFYLGAACLPTLPIKSIVINKSRLFCCYVGLQFLLNVLSCAGAVLLSMNRHSGMCVTDFTAYMYFGCLPIFAYVCLVRPGLNPSRPNLLFSYTTQVDDTHEDGTLSCSASIQSFSKPEESSIIKPGAVQSTVFSAALQSPDTVEDRDLLIP